METIYRCHFLLIHDNARPQNLRQIAKLLDKNRLKTLKWSASSSELSSIENLRGLMKNKVEKIMNKITNEA